MSPKGRSRKEGETTVKTTVDLPEALWRKAKVRAMDERTDLRQVVIAALESHLKPKPTRRQEGGR
jgi:hypothetical protein